MASKSLKLSTSLEPCRTEAFGQRFSFGLPFKSAGAVVKHNSSEMCVPVLLLDMG